VSQELTDIKEEYLSCSTELVVKQTELLELSSTFKEHVKHCSEQLQLANQNTERVEIEMQQQVESSTSLIKSLEESSRSISEQLEEKTNHWENLQRLKEIEASLSAISIVYLYYLANSSSR